MSWRGNDDDVDDARAREKRERVSLSFDTARGVGEVRLATRAVGAVLKVRFNVYLFVINGN